MSSNVSCKDTTVRSAKKFHLMSQYSCLSRAGTIWLLLIMNCENYVTMYFHEISAYIYWYIIISSSSSSFFYVLCRTKASLGDVQLPPSCASFFHGMTASFLILSHLVNALYSSAAFPPSFSSSSSSAWHPFRHPSRSPFLHITRPAQLHLFFLYLCRLSPGISALPA